MIRYDVGAITSANVSFPLNLALTGPTRAVRPTRNSSGPVCSIDSQPGMHFFRMSGLFSASQVVCCVAQIICSPLISIAQGELGLYVSFNVAWRDSMARSKLSDARIKVFGLSGMTQLAPRLNRQALGRQQQLASE